MFPLALTCLEEYMLCDDRPAYPMTGVFRLRFSGYLDGAAFEAAVAEAVRRHPLLRATVRRTGRSRPKWIEHPDWRPAVQWGSEINPYGFPAAGYMDLTRQPATRFWVVHRDDGDDVIAQVHHACADALGMTQVLEDLLIGYARELGAEEQVSLPELNVRHLRRRGAPGLTTWRFLRTAHQQAVGLLGAREFLLRRPEPLVPPAGEIDEALPPPLFPTPLVGQFDSAETGRIRATAKSRKVTVNDLLVRDLFLAVGTWRERRHLGSDRDWLRFSIPINLRSAADARMPMANSVSSVFLDRQGGDFCDADRLLEGIHEQMELIKRLRLQYTFILSLGVSRWLPGGIERGTRADRCPLTSWMSNLGNVFSQTPLPRRDNRVLAGNVVLESVDYVIPLRPHVHAAFCVYTYAGRLQILMHFDPRVIEHDMAQELLDAYLGQIRRTVEDGERRPCRS